MNGYDEAVDVTAEAELLEPLELLEEVELEEGSPEDFEAILDPDLEDELLAAPQEIPLLAFSGSSVPTAIVSRHLLLHFQNQAFGSIFPESAPGESFAKMLSTSLTLEELKQLLQDIESLFNGACNDQGGRSIRRYLHFQRKNHLPLEIVLLATPLENNLLLLHVDDVTQEHRKLLRGTFLSLLEASKLKDNDTGNHIKRVGEFAKMLAESLSGDSRYADQVSPGFIDAIHFLAPMHDVGKIGTPDDILNKEGPLDAKEWEIMKEHTINGAYILASYPDIMAKQIALHHHERWDGNGYPYSLAGEMIPLAARIVSIADVYDALRMRRSYKEAMDHDTASSIIRQGKNTQFDPGLLEHFVELEDQFKGVVESLTDEYQ